MAKKSLKELKQDIVIEANLKGSDLVFHTTWGLFSPEEIDAGTKLLIENINSTEGTILDLGCGYGAIGISLAKNSPNSQVHLIDKDFVAVEYAKRNTEINKVTNCQVYLSNLFSNIPPELKFDLIVSNLPAKVSKEFFWILFGEANNHLNPGGKFYAVTISGLKEFLKRNLQEIFGNYKKVLQNNRYVIFSATKS